MSEREHRFLGWARLDIVALIVAVLVGVGAATIWVNERNSRIDATRDLTCAIAEWNGDIVTYFETAEERLRSRLGTPDEAATDRAALIQVGILLAASQQLERDLGGECGPVIPSIQPPG